MVWGALASFAAPYIANAASGVGGWFGGGGASSAASGVWGKAAGYFGSKGGGGGLGGFFGNLLDDFTGKDIKKQQLFNIAQLLAAYNQSKGDVMGVGAPDTNNYMNALRQSISESGVRESYGAPYAQALQDLALRQGDVGMLAAARLATQAGGGRGASAFGGGASEQVRRAAGEQSGQTQQALLGARANVEEGRAGVSQQIAQLLAGGNQNALQADLSYKQALLAALGGLGTGLMGGIAGISPSDTNKTFDNAWRIISQFVGKGAGSSGGGYPGMGGGGI